MRDRPHLKIALGRRRRSIAATHSIDDDVADGRTDGRRDRRLNFDFRSPSAFPG